jgi:hypothetical protein
MPSANAWRIAAVSLGAGECLVELEHVGASVSLGSPGARESVTIE